MSTSCNLANGRVDIAFKTQLHEMKASEMTKTNVLQKPHLNRYVLNQIRPNILITIQKF